MEPRFCDSGPTHKTQSLLKSQIPAALSSSHTTVSMHRVFWATRFWFVFLFCYVYESRCGHQAVNARRRFRLVSLRCSL